MKFNSFTDTFNWFKDRLPTTCNKKATFQDDVELFLKRTHATGEVCRRENNREVFRRVLQTGPPSLKVPPGLPEPNDVGVAWLCHRSYEAMTEVDHVYTGP